jgi:hypothetical protein
MRDRHVLAPLFLGQPERTPGGEAPGHRRKAEGKGEVGP